VGEDASEIVAVPGVDPVDGEVLGEGGVHE
jgi:hypothetical protein